MISNPIAIPRAPSVAREWSSRVVARIFSTSRPPDRNLPIPPLRDAQATEPEKPQTKGKKKTATVRPLDDEDVVIEYVAAPLEVDAGDEAFAELNDVFQRFSLA